MSLNNENLSNDDTSEEAPNRDLSNSLNTENSTSATTSDHPSFGWSAYAERINGRFAMIGFIAILLVEIISRNSFLNWAGILK